MPGTCILVQTTGGSGFSLVLWAKLALQADTAHPFRMIRKAPCKAFLYQYTCGSQTSGIAPYSQIWTSIRPNNDGESEI